MLCYFWIHLSSAALSRSDPSFLMIRLISYLYMYWIPLWNHMCFKWLCMLSRARETLSSTLWSQRLGSDYLLHLHPSWNKVCQGNYSLENLLVLNNSVEAGHILWAPCTAWILVELEERFRPWVFALCIGMGFTLISWAHFICLRWIGSFHLSCSLEELRHGLCHSLSDKPGKPLSIIFDCWWCSLFWSRKFSAGMFYNIAAMHMHRCHLQSPLPATFLAGKSQLQCL